MPEELWRLASCGEGRTILLVEADAVYTAGKSRELEGVGFRVLEASSADAAATLLRSGCGVDLVLMDARLDAAKVGATRDIPLLFLYAEADSASVEKAASVPCYGLVPREADAVVLISSVVAALAQAAARKSLEDESRALRGEMERLSLAFEGSDASWWDWDVETGEMSVSARWSGMLGYGSEELGQIGIGTFDLLVHPEDLGKTAEITRRYFAGEISSHEIEIRLKRKDGLWLWIMDRGKASERGPDGKVVRVSGVNFDISERKAAEEKQRLLVEQTEGLMRELRHRVKNGLNLASSLLRLQMDELEDEAARKAIHDAVSRLRTMAAIYENLNPTSDLKSVDLGAYLGELSDSIFKAFAPEGSGLRLSLDTAALRIDSNRAVYIGLILNELLTNAVKYAYPGGEGEIKVELGLMDGKARLRVSDRGIGLPPLFDPDKATSLGMTLVSMLSSQIGADLRVETSGGTSFSLEFSQ